jgi:hypothetical protein
MQMTIRVGVMTLLGLLAGTAIAVESIAVVPRNSYLIRPVASAQELANQIRTEPVVAQRYARHFKRSAWEFAEYVEKHLHLTRLERAQTFNVYYSPPDDRLLVVRRTLPKGTPVFRRAQAFGQADSEGELREPTDARRVHPAAASDAPYRNRQRCDTDPRVCGSH